MDMKKLLTAIVAVCLAICAALSFAGCSILVGGTVLKYEGYETQGEVSAESSKAIYDAIENDIKYWYLGFDMKGTFMLTAKGETIAEGTWEQIGDNVTVRLTNGKKIELKGDGLIMAWTMDFSEYDPDVNVFVTFKFKLPDNH